MLLEVSQESLQGKALWISFDTIYVYATTGTRQTYLPLLQISHIQMVPIFNTYTNDWRLTNSRVAYPHIV